MVENLGSDIASATSATKSSKQKSEIRSLSNYKSYGQLSQLDDIPVEKGKMIGVMRGYDDPISISAPEKDGSLNIKLEEDGRIELHLSSDTEISRCTGYMVAGNRLRMLPIGSTLDSKKGIFYWQAGLAFLGKYQFMFVIEDADGKLTKRPVFVTINPKYNKI